MIGYGAATKFIEMDAECLRDKNLSQLIQTVADCFSSDGVESDGRDALFEVRSMCLLSYLCNGTCSI
jgi:hypothetical protein